MNKYIKYIMRYKWLYSLLIFACATTMVMQIVLPIIISKIGSGILTYEWDTIKKGCLIVFACAGIKLIFEYIWGHFNYYLSNKLLIEAENEYVQKYLRKQYESISGNNFMYLSQRINNDIVIIMDYYVEKFPLLISHLLKLVTIELVLFYHDIMIGLISLICIVLIVALFLLSRKKIFILSKNTSESESLFFAYVSERLSHVLEIKLGAKYKKISDDFEVVGDKYVKNAVRYLDFENIINLSGGFLTTIFLTIYILIAKRQYDINSDFVMAELIVLSIFYFQQLIDDTNYLLRYNGIYQKFLVSKRRLNDIINVQDDVDGKEVIHVIDEISIENLCFDYGDKCLINNLSFYLKKGKIYGIVGKNGSGKSSLLLIILGILKTKMGVVKWNGIDIGDINRTRLIKENIAVVPQEPILLGKTIRECVFEENILSSLKKEYIEMLEFVDKKERGYDTPVYINGSNMSGGEKQKIAIINSLLKNTDVIVLDEPTSALDKGSIRLLSRILQSEKKERITLIISHDEEILQICDEKLVLQ